ncbi:MAG: primosomal protein N' [Clostridiales bacterium]|nr:primosomal protein N' [Clostridiales bacterium]
MYAEVIVDISASNVDKIFDYDITGFDVCEGTRVKVPFGKFETEGFIIRIKQNTNYDKSKVKSIICAVDDFAVITSEMIELMHHMCNLYHLKYIDALRLFIPSEMRTGKVKSLSKKVVEFVGDKQQIEAKLRKNAKNQWGLLNFLETDKTYYKTDLFNKFTNVAVNKFVEMGVLQESELQNRRTPAFNKIDKLVVEHTNLQKRAITQILEEDGKTRLLFGVTGSGKTEVYMSTIENVISQGKTAIMLVPEISLTPQVLANFKARFGEQVAILHSGLSAGERFDEWKRIRLGEAKIVVGARSAIFAPITNVGIIIIDEEHEQSYNSESNPRYFTKDVAEFRKNHNNCKLVLGSATPSLESFYKAETGEYKLIEMPVRINGRDMPKIQIVDMLGEIRAGNNGMFSRTLLYELEHCFKNNKQAMLFINRRGFSSFMRCMECGYIAKCSDCDVSLVYHKDEEKLKCHYCGKRYRALTQCPECNSKKIRQGAVGTQKIVEALKEYFPQVKAFRMDNDTTQVKNAHQKILGEFAKTTPAVLVGTQMIAKGHDFKDVTLVGIVDGDQSLYQTDYKSTERTFELITQMAGRAGRNESEGKVILQTYAPRHYAYKFIANYNYKGFYSKEINLRETALFPPFTTIIRLLFTSENEDLVREITKKCHNGIFDISKEFEQDFVYFDAMKSPITKIQNKHRYQILIRIKKQNERQIIDKIFDECDKHQNAKVSFFVEINPQSLS